MNDIGVQLISQRSANEHRSSRRQFLGAAAVSVLSAASTDLIPSPAFATTGGAIRPFRIDIPEASLADLRMRLSATRWPDRETVADQSQGVRLQTLQQLVQYWLDEYDWRNVESRLNSLPQFITRIDGVDIHFLHVRSPHEDALPMIVTHGWPGSIIEQLKIIDPLTNPTAHGEKPSDAFHLVIPSLPGYGFSGKPETPGWDPVRVARAWIVLMRRLGYARYVAQGGDWGNAVTEQMALQAPRDLLGMHTNMPATVPANVATALQLGGAPPSGLSTEERHAYLQLDNFYKHGLGYAVEMANRPQTLYGIVDSPAGLAAWMLDHDARSLDLIARVFEGQRAGLSRDDVIDNITLYWLTNTAISSTRLYWENKLHFFEPKHVSIPVAVSVFPDEIYAAPRSWTERAYSNLFYFKKLEKGGHFAAWEQPGLFSAEMRAAFRGFRSRSECGYCGARSFQ